MSTTSSGTAERAWISPSAIAASRRSCPIRRVAQPLAQEWLRGRPEAHQDLAELDPVPVLSERADDQRHRLGRAELPERTGAREPDERLGGQALAQDRYALAGAHDPGELRRANRGQRVL